jgi:hypothetical protein
MPIKSKANTALLTLEFSTDMLVPLPGRLSLYSSPSAVPSVVSSCLNTPTSMAQDKDGQVYIVEIFTGRLLRVNLP